MKEQDSNFSRRNFIGTMAAASAVMVACSSAGKREYGMLPTQLDQAPDGPELKAGLVGCGGRGTGAAIQYLHAGPNLKLIALADVFQDRIDSSRQKIKDKAGQEVPMENCYVGFDAYQKLIDSGVDVVLLATPPHFRPEQFKAAIDAKKHVFMEKPVAVDPVGARSIRATADTAEAMGLSVVTGTQRRHQKHYIETYKKICDGIIGEIVAARCYWNGGQLWYKLRQSGWTNMEWMIRDWVNWCWLSGDHIVEQHVHNLDVVNWFTGMFPAKALGFGSRARRVTGDQFDFFSIDFEMPNGMHVHSMCRQINGCANSVSEFFVGTKGSCYTSSREAKIFKKDGSLAWEWSGEEKSPYDQEHIDLVTAIRTDSPYIEAKNTANSTMAAVMGRISAYTGKQITWDEMQSSDLKLGPSEYEMANVPMEVNIPVPGTKERG